MKTLKFSLAFALFFAVIFSGCESEKKEKNVDYNDSSPSLSAGTNTILNVTLKFDNKEDLFIKIKNKELEFDNEQKATLFVFFTTWCLPCTAAIPSFNNLQEKYKDSFNIVGVLLEEVGSEQLEDFIRVNNISYSITTGEDALEFAQAIGGISSIPSLLLYDLNGKFVNQYLGLIPQEMLDIDIQKSVM